MSEPVQDRGPSEETQTLDEIARDMAKERNSVLQGGGEGDEQRLIEVILSGLSREAFDDLLIELSELMHEKWPDLGAAVAGRYSLAEPLQDGGERPSDSVTIDFLVSVTTDGDESAIAGSDLADMLGETEPQPGQGQFVFSVRELPENHALRHPHQDVERLARERDEFILLDNKATLRAETAEAEVERLREALRDIAGDYGCGLLEPPDVSLPAREGDPCRERWPDDPSRWCVLCVASAALAPSPDARPSQFPTPQTQAMRDAVEAASPDDRGGER